MNDEVSGAPLVPHERGLMLDGYGRAARYLRLSATDRCNLRCLYCRSSARERHIPHDEVLRYEEMLRVVEAAVDAGVEKVRVTGGEPFMRKDMLRFLEMLRTQFPHVDVRLTTNGTLARPHAAALRDMGVTAVNLSLDSFRPECFAAIVGFDLLKEVRAAMDAIMAAGIRLKINAVGLRGFNDGDMADFIDFARGHPVDVRFIEFMPMGGDTRWSEANFWPAPEILEAARRVADLTPLEPEAGGLGGPARMFSIDGGLGRFGLITPMSNHFCGACNRLRVTSDGFLRTCLFADREYRLRGLLRHPRLGTDVLRRVMERANRLKPLGEEILRARRDAAVARKRMVAIGG